MQHQDQAILLVNFGGPRSLNEVEPFLRALLCDQEVIRSDLPGFFHRLLFNWVARKRAKTVRHDYAKIGGKSPIFDDTEAIASLLRTQFSLPILTYHRYLPDTHQDFIDRFSELNPRETIVFPLFPQFSFATTGSCAKWLNRKLPWHLRNGLRWIVSYAAHPAFIQAQERLIRAFMHQHQIPEEETLLLFSAHGLPKRFVCTGDIYKSECEQTFRALQKCFPKCESLLAYQSKFGKGEWLRPYTTDVCDTIDRYGRKQVLLIPLSFPSDHIETLFEMEELYLPLIHKRGLKGWRVPALNLRSDWIEAIVKIIQGEGPKVSTGMLLRDTAQKRCPNCSCRD